MMNNFFAIDTSSIVAYFQNDGGKDIELISQLSLAENFVLPPVVITEIFSESGLPAQHKKILEIIQTLPIREGYWERAGRTRAIILSKKLKCKTADALIAQSCIDNNTPLITRDTDFRHFAKHCGLKLA